jgi:phosphoribosylanthranilate isomerase
LHGDEDALRYDDVGARLLKSIALAGDADVDRAAALPPDVTPIVDASDQVRRGGTGQRANWHLAARLAAARAVVLAGGLNPDNVAEAIALVDPAAVDVSSGVEAAPGLKDPDRLAAFLDAVRAAPAAKGRTR